MSKLLLSTLKTDRKLYENWLEKAIAMKMAAEVVHDEAESRYQADEVRRYESKLKVINAAIDRLQPDGAKKVVHP